MTTASFRAPGEKWLRKNQASTTCRDRARSSSCFTAAFLTPSRQCGDGRAPPPRQPLRGATLRWATSTSAAADVAGHDNVPNALSHPTAVAGLAHATPRPRARASCSATPMAADLKSGLLADTARHELRLLRLGRLPRPRERPHLLQVRPRRGNPLPAAVARRRRRRRLRAPPIPRTRLATCASSTAQLRHRGPPHALVPTIGPPRRSTASAVRAVASPRPTPASMSSTPSSASTRTSTSGRSACSTAAAPGPMTGLEAFENTAPGGATRRRRALVSCGDPCGVARHRLPPEGEELRRHRGGGPVHLPRHAQRGQVPVRLRRRGLRHHREALRRDAPRSRSPTSAPRC